MAKKKKVVAGFPCVHCGVEFRTKLRWCPKCEDHMGEFEFLAGKDMCDRCDSGKNDAYIQRRKGRAWRVAEAVAEAMAKDTSGSPLIAAFEAWCASPEYARRFDDAPIIKREV